MQSARELLVLKSNLLPKEVLELDVLCETMKAMTKASQGFQNLTALVGNPSLTFSIPQKQ